MQQTSSQTGAVPSTGSRTPDSCSTRLIIRADRAIYRFSGHWLFAVNVLLVTVLIGIIAAPILQSVGLTQISQPLYRFFGIFCHQQDDRSFHVLGESFGCCERCTAVHASLAFSGAFFAVARTRLRAIRYPELLLLASPLVIDGMAVGAGIYGGNVVIRTITGVLFGIACIWAIYPRLDEGFATMRTRLETLFDRLVIQGRARPLT